MASSRCFVDFNTQGKNLITIRKTICFGNELMNLRLSVKDATSKDAETGVEFCTDFESRIYMLNAE